MEIKSGGKYGNAAYQKLFSDKTALYSGLFGELTQDRKVINREIPEEVKIKLGKLGEIGGNWGN